MKHLALGVDSAETLTAWKTWLEQHGIRVIGPVNHDDTWLSIYFADPNNSVIQRMNAQTLVVAPFAGSPMQRSLSEGIQPIDVCPIGQQ